LSTCLQIIFVDTSVLKNKYGKYATLRIPEIDDSTRSDLADEITFSYVIIPNGGGDFR